MASSCIEVKYIYYSILLKGNIELVFPQITIISAIGIQS